MVEAATEHERGDEHGEPGRHADEQGDQRVPAGGRLVHRRPGQELGPLGQAPPGDDRGDRDRRREAGQSSASVPTPQRADTTTAASPGPRVSPSKSAGASNPTTAIPATARIPATTPAPSARARKARTSSGDSIRSASPAR